MPKFVGYHYEESLPVKAGDAVTIRKGVTVKTVGRAPRPAGKTYRVRVDHVLCGIGEPGSARCSPPSVVWAGPGGYWSEADINDIPEAELARPAPKPEEP